MEILQLTEDEPAVDLDDFVRQHQGMVWRYLRLLGADSSEADDLMQETFLRVPVDAAGCCEVEFPGAFLRSVARNLLLGSRRAARRRVPTVAWSDSVDEFLARESRVLENQHVFRLRSCLSRLSDRARSAVELHYLEGCSYREVARKLGLRVNGLRTLLARARQMLRDCLGGSVRRSDAS